MDLFPMEDFTTCSINDTDIPCSFHKMSWRKKQELCVFEPTKLQLESSLMFSRWTLCPIFHTCTKMSLIPVIKCNRKCKPACPVACFRFHSTSIFISNFLGCIVRQSWELPRQTLGVKYYSNKPSKWHLQ